MAGLARGERLGPYEVLSAIGGGGMGEVYRARDTRLGRDVALKILPAEVANDPCQGMASGYAPAAGLVVQSAKKYIATPYHRL